MIGRIDLRKKQIICRHGRSGSRAPGGSGGTIGRWRGVGRSRDRGNRGRDEKLLEHDVS
jgi:hypothetical protein